MNRRQFLEAMGIVTLAGCGEIAAPAPGQVEHTRFDLQFCYYGSDDLQFSETVDHINLFMPFRYLGPERQLLQMQLAAAANIPIMLDLPEAYQITLVDPPVFDLVESEKRIRARLSVLRQAALTQHVTYVYPIDEPNLSRLTNSQINQTNGLIRSLLTEYNVNAKLACIYAPHVDPTRLVGLYSYDLVGFDNYKSAERIFFVNGEYDKFRAALLPHQKIIVVPGGCDKWRQDPTPFYNKAIVDPKVALIMPFIWMDNADPRNNVFVGIRSNGLAPAYRKVGTQIKLGRTQ